jgi:hypothetical protein
MKLKQMDVMMKQGFLGPIALVSNGSKLLKQPDIFICFRSAFCAVEVKKCAFFGHFSGVYC